MGLGPLLPFRRAKCLSCLAVTIFVFAFLFACVILLKGG